MTMAEACKLAHDKHVVLQVCSDWMQGGYVCVKVMGRTKDEKTISCQRVYHPNDLFSPGFEIVVDCDIHAMIDKVSSDIE